MGGGEWVGGCGGLFGWLVRCLNAFSQSALLVQRVHCEDWGQTPHFQDHFCPEHVVSAGD